MRKAGLHPHKRPPIRRKTIAILLRKTTIASPKGKGSAGDTKTLAEL